MTVRSRESKVLAILIVSLVIGTIVLNALSHNPLTASSFSLSQYYHLDSEAESVDFRTITTSKNWMEKETQYGNRFDAETQINHEADLFSDQLDSSYNRLEGYNTDGYCIICDGFFGPYDQLKTTDDSPNHTTQNRINVQQD